MVGKQRAAPYALPLAEPGARQPRHAVGDLAQHETAAHRHAMHRAAGHPGKEQAEQQAARKRGAAAQRRQDVATKAHAPTQARSRGISH